MRGAVLAFVTVAQFLECVHAHENCPVGSPTCSDGIVEDISMLAYSAHGVAKPSIQGGEVASPSSGEDVSELLALLESKGEELETLVSSQGEGEEGIFDGLANLAKLVPSLVSAFKCLSNVVTKLQADKVSSNIVSEIKQLVNSVKSLITDVKQKQYWNAVKAVPGVFGQVKTIYTSVQAGFTDAKDVAPCIADVKKILADLHIR